MSESSPVQPTSTNPPGTARSTAPARGPDANATSQSAPNSAGFASKNQGGKMSNLPAEPLKGLSKNESAAQNAEHHHFTGAGRLGGHLSPNIQFNSPGWASFQSPLNYMRNTNPRGNGFAAPQTPGLSHSVMTPNSAESVNLLFPAGYTPHHTSSVRSPSVAIATPSDNSHPFLANHIFNSSQRAMNPADLQGFLAERQLLLQQQALLMSMYQKSNQTPAALQALNQLPGMNRLNQTHTIYPTETQGSYGVYNKESTLDPKLQFFGLLPPIALPATQPANKPSDVLRKRAGGPWRSQGVVEMSIDFPGGLRPNAVTFTPAGSNSPRGPHAKISQVEDISRGGESPVYQIPGRRSVSDPASTLLGGKKTNALAYLQSKTNNVRGALNGYQSKLVGDKTMNSKRVTFAEHNTPARRVVSHGEVPGTPISSNMEEDSRDSEDGNLDLSSESTYNNAQKYSIEEARRVEDVKSVDIAMERLRLAAAPIRLSHKESVST